MQTSKRRVAGAGSWSVTGLKYTHHLTVFEANIVLWTRIDHGISMNPLTYTLPLSARVEAIKCTSTRLHECRSLALVALSGHLSFILFVSQPV